MKCWIARDRTGLFCFRRKPTWKKESRLWLIAKAAVGEFSKWADELFPEIHEGECYEAEITLGEKV